MLLFKVRAGSLQDLIYKHGQAGITKATVSIKFDNTNRDQCPIGLEAHEEFTVTRQVLSHHNKYLLGVMYDIHILYYILYSLL